MLIDEYRGRLPITKMCELVKVSKTAYYNWSSKMPSVSSLCSGDKLSKEMEDIVNEFSGYGYRRVTAELKRRKYAINHKKVLRIMRLKNLTKRKKRRYIPTTCSAHNLPVHPNLAKDIVPTATNQLWVADITYIYLSSEFVYLAAILDAFSRKVVGWALKSSLSQELSLSALRMALMKRNFSQGLIHHSDRGVQYACKDYVNLLRNHGIAISMSAKGNPYENAQAESFMATLKREEVYLFDYENMAEAQERIGYFIEDVYNTKRLHSSLEYLPPAEFESKLESELATVNVS